MRGIRTVSSPLSRSMSLETRSPVGPASADPPREVHALFSRMSSSSGRVGSSRATFLSAASTAGNSLWLHLHEYNAQKSFYKNVKIKKTVS